LFIVISNFNIGLGLNICSKLNVASCFTIYGK